MNIPSTHPDLDQAIAAFRAGVGDDWSRLEARLRTVNADIATRGTLPHTIRDVTRELLTGYSYGEIYDWDLYFEYLAMARLAAALDLPESVVRYTALAKEVEQKIESLLWDETDGFYYDRNERTGEAVRVKTVAGLLPLWSFDIQPQRAERLVREHLLNPDEFWRPYPVASWAKSEPDYYQESRYGECNWMGPTWIPCNYMLTHGLARRGYRDEALDLAWRTFRLALQNETTREYYNAETGTGLGLDPFWGWSALAYLLPLEILAGLDPTRLDGRPLLPLAKIIGLGATKAADW